MFWRNQGKTFLKIENVVSTIYKSGSNINIVSSNDLKMRHTLSITSTRMTFFASLRKKSNDCLIEDIFFPIMQLLCLEYFPKLKKKKTQQQQQNKTKQKQTNKQRPNKTQTK